MERGTLPSYLYISGVKKVSKNPVGCGGFADVWIGEASGQKLALKVLRDSGQYVSLDVGRKVGNTYVSRVIRNRCEKDQLICG